MDMGSSTNWIVIPRMLVTVIAEHVNELTERVSQLLPVLSPRLLKRHARTAVLAYQWAAIIPKDSMHFTSGMSDLHFYSTNKKKMEYTLPCKVSCGKCQVS